MNYRNPELLDRLAAEYVVGTLRGRARQRFERLLTEVPECQERVDTWQAHLAALPAGLEPVQPPPRVWRNIQDRLWGGLPQPGRTALRIWRSWAVAASVAVAVMVVVQWPIDVTDPVPERVEVAADRIALIHDEDGEPMWVVQANLERQLVAIRAARTVTPDDDHAHELWVIADDHDPVSLGVLPEEGRLERPLTAELQALMARAQALAVSVEPAGGSPTGLPTGPVILEARLITG
ncbi:anti-sigma factor domain-containing protein [Thioalkalivibrio sp. ALJT]|uniref:anti-sigma factor n=1 Tax=Thioalkalivibrio sp. ALJT TaxID=1158146 RepID=UPI00037B9685|nr:anti-sigma factor [Thioalkalivibrio sp. ALJT]